jgi:hypothetical protein
MTTSRRLPWVLFLLLAALPPGAGRAEPTTTTPEPPTVTSVPVDACPRMDGSAEDAAWRWAPETEVRMTEPTAAGTSPRGWIRSVHDAEWVWFLVTWEDGTKDVEHRPWTWNEGKGTYEEGKQREDMLTLSFERAGPFSADPLAPEEATFDEWNWKAARTDPVGHAMDRFERRTRTKPEGEAHELKARDGTTTWVIRGEDAGDSIQTKRDAPATNEGERVPRYVATTPTDSAADVRAKGAWKSGRWTVELERALATGFPDDTDFDLARPLLFAVAAPRGNAESDAGSGALRLRWGRKSATRDFDDQVPGKGAAGFRAGLTGGGGPVSWVVEPDPDRPQGRVLAQRSQDSTDYRFPICVLEGFSAKDLDLSVRFRTVSGEVDRAAGLVWRHRDAGNYYLVRANALEGNVVLYRVKDGKREDLPLRGLGQTYGVEAPVPKEAWGTLRVVCVGRTMEVYLDGRKLFDVDDDTISDAGGVGVWTKADSVTLFDDLVAVSYD